MLKKIQTVLRSMPAFLAANWRLVLTCLFLGAGVVDTALAEGPAYTDPITADSFNSVATTMLKYLGLAVGAGLVVLIAVVSTMSAWKFVSKFIKA